MMILIFHFVGDSCVCSFCLLFVLCFSLFSGWMYRMHGRIDVLDVFVCTEIYLFTK